MAGVAFLLRGLLCSVDEGVPAAYHPASWAPGQQS